MGLQQPSVNIFKDHISSLNSRFIMNEMTDIKSELEALKFVIEQTEKNLPLNGQIIPMHQLMKAS